MKKILVLLAFLLIPASALAQSTPPLCVSEIDGSPSKCGITRIKVSNGSLTISGNTATITTGGGGGLTVGTTAIASGTAGRLLYEAAGNVLGEVSTLTSDGTIITLSPTVTTGTGATSGLNANANSLTTGDAFNFASSSVTSGNVFKIAATGTAAASNTKTALNVATSGANGTSTQTTYGAQFSNTSTGTSSTNIALFATASGGTNNYAGILAGRVGINNTAPLAPLHVGNAAVLSSVDAQILASQTVDNSGAGNAHGFSDSSQIQRSGTIGYASFDARATITGNGGYNYDHTVGFQSAISHATIGTITAIYGFYSQPSRSNGPVTNIYGYYAAAPVFASGGSATSGNYGLYVEDLGTGAGIYSIYTNGTTASRFGGSVTVAGSLLGGNAIQAGATSYIYWATSTSFRNRADGVLTLSNFAENDFNRLQLGGTTSAFPAIGRSGANIVILAADGTSDGKLLVGSPGASVTGNFTAMASNAATNSIVDIARLGVNSTGTAAAGFGGSLSLSAETSTTNDQQAGSLGWLWTDATHASRTGAVTISTVSAAGSNTERLRIDHNGLTLAAVLFANLASTNGILSYCSDCAVTSGADNTCAGSGTGALAIRLNGTWRCFIAQN